MKKIFIYLLVLLSLFSIGFSALNDSEAYWAFDTSTGQLNDSSGNNYTLTNYGATSSTGKLNEGFLFDGTNDYIKFPDLGLVNGTTDFSFGHWAKFDTTTTNMAMLSFQGEVESYSKIATGGFYLFHYKIGATW